MTTPTITTTTEYCSLPSEILDEFATRPFNNTAIIEWMHSVPPRYGKPNDMLLLLRGSENGSPSSSGSSSDGDGETPAIPPATATPPQDSVTADAATTTDTNEGGGGVIASAISSATHGQVVVNSTEEDYLRGLLASSITIMVFFLLWSCLLLTAKCCCGGGRSGGGRGGGGTKKEKRSKGGGVKNEDDNHHDDEHCDGDHHDDDQYNNNKNNNNSCWKWLAGQPLCVPPMPPQQQSMQVKVNPPQHHQSQQGEAQNQWQRQREEYYQHHRKQQQAQQQAQQPHSSKEQEHDHYDCYDTNDEDRNCEYEDWIEDYRRAKTKLLVFRIIVVLAGLSIVVSAIVMSVGGVNALAGSLDAARSTISLVDGLATDATVILDNVIQQNANVAAELRGLLEGANFLCPALAPDGICDAPDDDNSNNNNNADADLLQSCDFSNFTKLIGLDDSFNDEIQTVLEHFAKGERSVIYQEIIAARAGLAQARSMAQSADQTAQQFDWALWLSMTFSLLLAVLVLVLLSSLVPWCRRKQSSALSPSQSSSSTASSLLACVQSKFVMPLMVLLVTSAYIFSLVFVTASIATADLCIYESPSSNVDVRVLTLLERFEQTLSPVVVEFASFYIQQCPEEALPQEVVEQLQYVLAGVPVIQQFSAIVEESTDVIDSFCQIPVEVLGDTNTTTNITNATTVELDGNGDRQDTNLDIDVVNIVQGVTSSSRAQDLVALAERVEVQLCGIAEILRRVRLFFQCERWFPLYETATYEALCTDGTNGFAYVASTQFVIVFMAFVLLTFRVAFWDVQVGDGDLDRGHDSDRGVVDNVAPGDNETFHCQQSYYPSLQEKLRENQRLQERVRQSRLRQQDMTDDADPSLPPPLPSPPLSSSSPTKSLVLNATYSTEEDYFSDGHATPTHSGSTTEEEEDDDCSGEIILEDAMPIGRVSSCRLRPSVDEDASVNAEGIEVEHYDSRQDAWGIWARQLWGGGNQQGQLESSDDGSAGEV